MLWNHQQFLNVIRGAVSFAILLIPTTAMGLTLPILLEDPLLKRREFGRSIGLFYGINTFGAMTGALIGEAYLIRACGLFGTGLAAAALSCIAAGIAWIFAATGAAGGEQTPPQLRLRLPSGRELAMASACCEHGHRRRPSRT